MKAKRLFLMLICMGVLSFIMAVGVMGQEVASGTCGDNLTWTLDGEGTLTISGTGEMTNWLNYSSVPWDSYRNSINRVEIPDGVTNLGSYAFYHCENLANITIPDGVTSIGTHGFSFCPNLTNITIPDSVINISYYAFYSCTSLISIDIPKNVTRIGKYTFEGCTNLSSVKIPDSITAIEKMAFYGCSSLTDIYYTGTEEQWNKIDFDMNNHDIFRANITFNYSPISIVASGTCGENLTWTLDDEGTLTISGTGEMKDFGTEYQQPWYSYQDSIKKLIIETGITKTGKNAFSGCDKITKVELPSTLIIIGRSSFQGTRFKTIEIPSSVTTIEYQAFYASKALESIEIPSSVKTIGESAFSYCDKLKNITFSKGINQIGRIAFKESYSIANVTFNGTIDEWNEIVIDSGNTYLTQAFTYCVNDEKYISMCGDLTCILDSQGSLTITGNGKMEKWISFATIDFLKNSVKSIVINNGVTHIASEALRCKNLTNITIPESITSIGSFAFSICTNLSDVYYAGTQEQWNEIEIANGNECLLNANIIFGAGETSGAEITTSKSVYTEGENIDFSYKLPDNYSDEYPVCTAIYDVNGVWREFIPHIEGFSRDFYNGFFASGDYTLALLCGNTPPPTQYNPENVLAYCNFTVIEAEYSLENASLSNCYFDENGKFHYTLISPDVKNGAKVFYRPGYHYTNNDHRGIGYIFPSTSMDNMKEFSECTASDITKTFDKILEHEKENLPDFVFNGTGVFSCEIILNAANHGFTTLEAPIDYSRCAKLVEYFSNFTVSSALTHTFDTTEKALARDEEFKFNGKVTTTAPEGLNAIQVDIFLSDDHGIGADRFFRKDDFNGEKEFDLSVIPALKVGNIIEGKNGQTIEIKANTKYDVVIYANDKDGNNFGSEGIKKTIIFNDETANRPTVSGAKDNYTITLGENLTLEGIITAVGNGKLNVVNLKHNEVGTTFEPRRKELNGSTNTFNFADFGVLTTEEYPLNTVGTHEFVVYASADNFTVTNNNVLIFTVNVLPKPVEKVNSTVECMDEDDYAGNYRDFTITFDKMPTSAYLQFDNQNNPDEWLSDEYCSTNPAFIIDTSKIFEDGDGYKYETTFIIHSEGLKSNSYARKVRVAVPSDDGIVYSEPFEFYVNPIPDTPLNNIGIAYEQTLDISDDTELPSITSVVAANKKSYYRLTVANYTHDDDASIFFYWRADGGEFQKVNDDYTVVDFIPEGTNTITVYMGDGLGYVASYTFDID